MSEHEPDEAILRKVQGMLNVAAKAGTPEEAANAMAMAQRFMEQHNITQALLERSEGKDGKRKKEEVTGGHYVWQRELWGALAELKFCLHWVQEYRAVRTRTERSVINPNRVYYKGEPITKTRHVLVGRVINVLDVQNTGNYIEQTINRLLRERLTDSEGNFNSKDYNGRFGISFREGIADDIMVRLNERRRKQLAADARRKKAAASGASTGSDLVLSTYIDEETDANNDFLHGKGWSAEQARRVAARALERKLEREAYTAWARANPEEAARKAEEERKRARRRGGFGSGPKERQKDWGAYRMGQDAGKNVSLDPQMGGKSGAAKLAGPKAMHMGSK